MGSPEGLKRACDARREELGVDSWVGNAPSADSRFVRSVVECIADIPADATITDSILYEGATVQPGESVVREIRGRGFCWKL